MNDPQTENWEENTPSHSIDCCCPTCDRERIEDAAVTLAQRIRETDCDGPVGIGEHEGKPSLFIYTRKKNIKKSVMEWIKDGHEGFNVTIRKTGPIRPL